jgi:hypothetical protein
MFSRKAVALLAVLFVLTLTVVSQAATKPTQEYAISVNLLAGGVDPDSGSLTHLTISGNVVTAANTITIGCRPTSIHRTVDKAYEYIACTSPANGDGIVVIRTADDAIVGKIAVLSPVFVLVRSGDKKLYVGQTNGSVTTVDITKQLDGSRKNVVIQNQTIDLGAANSVTGLAFVAVTSGSFLTIGTNTGLVFVYTAPTSKPPVFVASHQVVTGVQAVGLSSDATKAYAFLANSVDAIDGNGNVLPSGNVHVMDTSTLTVQKTILCSLAEMESAVLVRKQYFYISQFDGTVCTVDSHTDSVVNSLVIGNFLRFADVVGNRYFVADSQDNVVETVKLKNPSTGDQQGVSFGNLPANSVVIGASVF